MFQLASGGGGAVDGGGGTYNNGQCHHQGTGNGDGHVDVTGPRPRKGRHGRSRDRGGGSDPRVPPQQKQETEKDSSPCTNYDMAYFHSYAHGSPRHSRGADQGLCAYENIQKCDLPVSNQEQIAGKVAVDVGCGSGCLASFLYFVLKQGPDGFMQWMQGILQFRIINCICPLRDVEIEEKVDVINSGWMGYMLLYENMLGCVITARDKWLKPGVLMLPSYATLYMAPISHPDHYSDSIDF